MIWIFLCTTTRAENRVDHRGSPNHRIQYHPLANHHQLHPRLHPIPVDEATRQEWQELDHLLVHLWTTCSICPVFTYEKTVGLTASRVLVPELLPEPTRMGSEYFQRSEHECNQCCNRSSEVDAHLFFALSMQSFLVFESRIMYVIYVEESGGSSGTPMR